MISSDQFITKSEYVYSLMKDKILKGEWGHGERIIISKVAEDLNISAIPVREALKQLERDGLIENIPHKGATVIAFDMMKIKEITSIRSVLEGYAARTAVACFDDEKLNRLKEMQASMEKCANNQNYVGFGELNKEFHRYIYRQSPYPMLYDMIFNLWDGGNWARAIFIYNTERMKSSCQEHKSLIEAIENGDEERVEQLIRQHRNKTAEEFERLK